MKRSLPLYCHEVPEGTDTPSYMCVMKVQSSYLVHYPTTLVCIVNNVVEKQTQRLSHLQFFNLDAPEHTTEEFFAAANSWDEAGRPYPLAIWLSIKGVQYRMDVLRIAADPKLASTNGNQVHIWGDVASYAVEGPRPRNKTRSVRRPEDGSRDKVFTFPRHVASTQTWRR